MRENYAKLCAALVGLLAYLPLAGAQASAPAVEVLFNYPVAEASDFVVGTDGDAISARLVALVDGARATVDVAAYNFDHAPLASALRRAHARGVRVRVVTDIDTQHPSLLSPRPEYFWAAVNGPGLMHHKFVVVDAGDPAVATVLTGSCNFTDANIYRFYNDVLILRSPVLAQAYTQEFELLWGSDTALPNGRDRRAGSDKPRRSPTTFAVGELQGALYFSPNDEVTDRIVAEVGAARTSIGVQLLILTNDAIAAALRSAIARGVEVFGVIENFDDPSSDFASLNSVGASLRAHPLDEVVHHKYGVFDAARGDAAVVVTGSHNWTYSAETTHDENTLVVTGSALLASVYHEAARARHCALGAGAACATRVSDLDRRSAPVSRLSVYPNPSRGDVAVRYAADRPVRGYRVLDVAGRPVAAGLVAAGADGHIELNLAGHPAGTYALQLGLDGGWDATTLFYLTN